MKRILAVHKDHKHLHGNQVNDMIWESCLSAVDKLTDRERDYILAEGAELETQCKRLGEKGSLELLAAVGDILNKKGMVKNG
jgi:hypothetical protein